MHTLTTKGIVQSITSQLFVRINTHQLFLCFFLCFSFFSFENESELACDLCWIPPTVAPNTSSNDMLLCTTTTTAAAAATTTTLPPLPTERVAELDQPTVQRERFRDTINGATFSAVSHSRLIKIGRDHDHCQDHDLSRPRSRSLRITIS
jgi:hypothetical protein